jgi:hypothetical protein
MINRKYTILISISAFIFIGLLSGCNNAPVRTSSDVSLNSSEPKKEKTDTVVTPAKPIYVFDTIKYDQKLIELANGDSSGRWPVKNQPYPLQGAILPFKRVVAFYGNLYSKRMGILGQLPPAEMLAQLDDEVKMGEGRSKNSSPACTPLYCCSCTGI